MAEILLGAVVTVLVEKLASSDLINLARSAGILSELQKWNNNLDQIQALLVDAGQNPIRNTSVQVWLLNLQHLAYDIDNVLDDLGYEALRRKLNKESDHTSTSTGTRSSSNKVWKIIPTCCTAFTLRNLVYGHNMSSKMNEITTRLLHLVDQKKILGLVDDVERSVGTSKQVEQTSLVDESKFVGREGDKEALLQLLKEPSDENTSVVSIVGMGGIGKTTLANVLYKEVKDQFELSSWVCVSNDFNLFKISKVIYKDVCGEDRSFESLNQLHQALQDKLSHKKFIVVLDDVWNESYEKWEVFQRPFGVGAPGSKIIVTTRNTMVASVMDSVQPYHLKVLSDDEALSLFAQHALGKSNFDSHPILRFYGEGIVKKCNGLPLALMTLGRALRRKTNVKVWEYFLNSDMWSLQDGSDILPALRLSYCDLPSHLKRVFTYCSLFPKAYLFEKGELVLLWMAEGLLNPSNGTKSMENLGCEYFEELESRSFFEQSTNYKSQYTMHDLINDLATSTATEFFYRTNDITGNEPLEKLHHFSLAREELGQYRNFEALHRASCLQTLLVLQITSYYTSEFALKDRVIVDLLPHLQFLRALRLTHYSIRKVPRSIGNLKHIRYLNFSYTLITCLPEQVSDLYNLQSLLVHGCHNLSSLPHSFEKLINLRHLDIRDTPRLKKIPLGIGGLTSLRTLSKVIIEEAKGFKISELKGLSNLHGQLSIMGLHKVKNSMHAHEARLCQKVDLDVLEMEWSDAPYGPQNEVIAYNVLEELRPHDKLKQLNILFYNGTRFPGWVGDPSFDQLTDLTLRGCRSCTRLPTLGHLRSLRNLVVGDMDGVKILDFELLFSADSRQGVAFPSLEVLEFRNMKGWETWSTNSGDNNGTDGSFPRLYAISIISCPKLAEVSIGSIPLLQFLWIDGCNELVLRKMVGVSSSIQRLTLRSIIGLTHLDEEIIIHLRAVEYLSINSCNELRYLWKSESKACTILSNLRELRINSCDMLLSVGGKEANLGICVKSVREVFVQDCKRLESYNCLHGTEKLELRSCSSMTSLTFDHPPTLKFLTVYECNILEESSFHNLLSSLESLSINMWSRLRSFPEGYFAQLTTLIINKCHHLESIPENGFGFLPNLCLRRLDINDCQNLKSFPHQHLQSLTSLKEMRIYNCASMDDSFPCGSWPPNLSTLEIGSLKKPVSKWGPQKFPTSLVTLILMGQGSGVVSFTYSEDVMNGVNTTSMCFLLPPSLTSLTIEGFMDLESLSDGLQHLIFLEQLCVASCPKLRDLPKTLLPLLSSLTVFSCPKLEKRCRAEKGDYWPIISQIHSFHLHC